MVTIWILMLLRAIPVVVAFNALDGAEVRCGFSFFVVVPVFFLVFFFGHKLLRLVCRYDPLVFLDKTCIHQTDKALQEEGIHKLGAFLRKSSSMVIIYTDL